MLRRVDQLLASLGYGSRRDIAHFVRTGRVSHSDGTVISDPGLRVSPPAILFDRQALDPLPPLVILMHKPVGLVCSHDPGEGPLVYDLLPPRWLRRSPPIATIGRLDKDTTGTLLLTDDGPLNHRLTSPRHKIEKTYLATLDGEITGETIAAFASGTLELANDPKSCLPARLIAAGPGQARVVLTEGRYHQVRRMFAACGLHVTALHREAFGPHSADHLAPGAWEILDATSF